jgi:hypothetical protein
LDEAELETLTEFFEMQGGRAGRIVFVHRSVGRSGVSGLQFRSG